MTPWRRGLVAGATLEKTNYPEREQKNGEARAKADDAKDQTGNGDTAATKRAKAGCDPPAGDETHDRRHRTEQKPRPDENDREDERQDARDEGSVSKAVDTMTGIFEPTSPLVTTKRWRRRVTHGSRVQRHRNSGTARTAAAPGSARDLGEV